MYLTDYINGRCDISVSKYDMDGTTYVAYHRYWLNELFYRVMRLFVWEGIDPINQKELEKRLLMSGMVTVTKYERELTAFWCTLFGVTKYEDEFTNVTIRCPVYAGTRTLGKDAILISNNSVRNPLLPLVNHYAQLLAHTEVTLINALVNVRDSGGVPTISTEKQKQSMKAYYRNLYNGKHDTVTDIANLGVEYIGISRNTNQNIKDIIDTRNNLIKAFYSDIGIRAAFAKNSNAVIEEIISDTSQLIFNIKDMLETRKKGCEAVNELYGTNWSVHIAKEIDYENINMVSGNQRGVNANNESYSRDNSQRNVQGSEADER